MTRRPTATIWLLLAMLASGCASPPTQSMHAPAAWQPMGSAVRPGLPQHPTVSGIQRCLIEGMRRVGSLQQLMVIVERVDSEATNSTYAPGLPQPQYNTYVTQVLSELGFTPLLLSRGLKEQGLEEKHYIELRPDLIVQGSVVGFDALVARWRDARDGGIGFGGGRGSTAITGSEEQAVSLGQVTATVVLRVPRAIPHPSGASQTHLMVFPATSTGSATAEFRMTQNNRQSSASLVIGLGAGQARERVSVVDVQSAALFAVRMAVLLALAQQFNLSTPVCTA